MLVPTRNLNTHPEHYPYSLDVAYMFLTQIVLDILRVSNWPEDEIMLLVGKHLKPQSGDLKIEINRAWGAKGEYLPFSKTYLNLIMQI